jgi:hypothetical protein
MARLIGNAILSIARLLIVTLYCLDKSSASIFLEVGKISHFLPPSQFDHPPPQFDSFVVLLQI